VPLRRSTEALGRSVVAMGKKRALSVWESYSDPDAPRRPRGKKRADDDSETLNEKRADDDFERPGELRGWTQAGEDAALREEIERFGCALIVLIFIIVLTFLGVAREQGFPV